MSDPVARITPARGPHAPTSDTSPSNHPVSGLPMLLPLSSASPYTQYSILDTLVCHLCTGAPLRFAPLHCLSSASPATRHLGPPPATRNDSVPQRETGNRNVTCGHDSFRVTGDGHGGQPLGCQPFSLQPPEAGCRLSPVLVSSGPRVLVSAQVPMSPCPRAPSRLRRAG